MKEERRRRKEEGGKRKARRRTATVQDGEWTERMRPGVNNVCAERDGRMQGYLYGFESKCRMRKGGLWVGVCELV